LEIANLGINPGIPGLGV